MSGRNDDELTGGANSSPAPAVGIHLPCVQLRPYVTFYYFVVAHDALVDFLYPEWGNVRFALSGEWRVSMDSYGPDPQIDVLFGPTDRCARVTSTGGRVAGFGLTPLGWHRFIGTDASLMANRVRRLQDELGEPGARLHAAFAADTTDTQGVERFDRLLTSRLAGTGVDEPSLVALDRVLRERPVQVTDLSDRLGVSSRTLQRLCLRFYGFAPKRLLRRQRFLDTLGKVRVAVGESLETALDGEYVDQPHFYRDFRDFMGMSPRSYFRAARVLMSRAAAAQADAGVTLSFRLPPVAT